MSVLHRLWACLTLPMVCCGRKPLRCTCAFPRDRMEPHKAPWPGRRG